MSAAPTGTPVLLALGKPTGGGGALVVVVGTVVVGGTVVLGGGAVVVVVSTVVVVSGGVVAVTGTPAARYQNVMAAFASGAPVSSIARTVTCVEVKVPATVLRT